MNRRRFNNITIAHTRIFFPHFDETNGNCNFSVIVDDMDTVDYLRNCGVNVKEDRYGKDEGEEPNYYIQVKIKFVTNPVIRVYGNGKRTTYTEDNIALLQGARIADFRLIANPYEWERTGKSGVSVGLRALDIQLASNGFDDDFVEVGNEGTSDHLPF